MPAGDADEMLAEGKQRARERFIKHAMVHDSSVVSPLGTELDLDGESTTSLDDAIRNAIARATEVVPEIETATLRDVRVDVDHRGVKHWHVVLRTALKP